MIGSSTGRLWVPLAMIAMLYVEAPVCQAGVDVEFVNVDRYADGLASLSDERVSMPVVLDSVAQTLRRAAACLPAQSELAIRVTDLHLAGRLEWWHAQLAPSDVRILRDDSWPTMDVEYQLVNMPGAAPEAGHEHLADMNYLHRGTPSDVGGDYPYERRMVRDWFSRRFCRH